MHLTHPDLVEALKPFSRLSEICLAHLLEAPEDGIKVAGIYCAFAPEEIIRAAGMIPVTLCGKDETPISIAERELPAALCPLIKSSYGYALSQTCPYFAASDIIIGETTCDGKKKMFELMGKLKPVYVMQLPYAHGNDAAKDFWRAEVVRLKKYIEQQTGADITDDALEYQIDLLNRRNEKLLALAEVMAVPVPPLRGRDILMVTESRNVAVDLEAYNMMLDQLLDTIAALEVSEKPQTSALSMPRILITGCPMGIGSDKVLALIEELGGLVVAQEHCGGLKSIFRHLPLGDDLVTAIADHYLGMPCACMSPNIHRMDYLEKLIQQFHIDALIDVTLQNCQPYTVEHTIVSERVENQLGIPVLHINTGYSPSDIEQIRVRVEAFLEMI